MIFKTTDSPKTTNEKVNYTPSLPKAPRCSLDFKVYIENHNGSVTIIDDTQLRLESFQGHESLSKPYEFKLELRANDYTAGAQSEFDTAVYDVVDDLEDIDVLSKKTGQNIKNNFHQPYGELLDEDNKYTQQLSFNQIIGANATIIIGTPETDNDVDKGIYPSARPAVYFNGIISNFALGERGVYHAILKPALFKLSLQNNYRLFPDATILTVISEVLSENNIAFNKTELEKQTSKVVMGLATYRKQDWLQAGESDFDFITRLMTKVNLFYYFTHTKNSHTMIITDLPYYKTIYKREVNQYGFNQETDKIKPLYLSYSQQESLDRDDYITEFKYQQNLTTNGLTTVLAQKEATWESQRTAQASPVFLDRENEKEKLNMEQIHIVQYGASKSEISKLTDTTMNKLAAAKYDFSGSSSCVELKPGHKFQVLEAWQQAEGKTPIASSYSSPLPICPSLNEREFVATSVQHQASALGDYKNQFSAVAAQGLPTPFNPHEGQQGSILARVTVKPSSTLTTKTENKLQSELAINEVGHKGSSAKQLEKTVFTYDSKDFKYQIKEDGDDNFFCRGVYVRFIDQPESVPAQWVKLAEHMTTVPEVGVYVVVSRSQDSNEIPEIQQALEAKGSKNIMPEGYSTQTSVGNNYNTSYGNSTSIGFGADVKTPLNTAQNIVNNQRESDDYNNVSFNESSNYGYNVSERSHNISMTGVGTPPTYNPSDIMNYVSYGHNATYGDTYNQSYSEGNSTNKSITNGNTTSTSEQTGNISSSNTVKGDTSNKSNNTGDIKNNSHHIGMSNNVSTQTGTAKSTSHMKGTTKSASYTTGMTNSLTNINGATNSVLIGIGLDASESTRTGIITNVTNINGGQISDSLITGFSINTSMTIGSSETINTVSGNSTNTTTITGNTIDTKTIVGNSTETTTYTGLETKNGVKTTYVKNEVVVNETSNETKGSVGGVNTKVADNTVTSIQADNSVESTTTQNKVANISAGTTTTNDTSVVTANRSQVTEIYAGTRVML